MNERPRKPASANGQPAPAALRTLESSELEQIAAATSKPGGAGDGRGQLPNRCEVS